MGYTKEIYQKAVKTIDDRRYRAERLASTRQEELYGQIPQLRTINQELALTGSNAARAALSGGENALLLIEQLKQRNQVLLQQKKELLKGAGFPGNYLAVPYFCTNCGDTGYIGSKRCSCLTDLLRKFAYEQLSDGYQIDGYRFEDFSLHYYSKEPSGKYGTVPFKAMQRILAICMAYANEFGNHNESLLLCGGTGLGKTHLSLAVANAVTAHGFGVIYTPVQRLMDKLQVQQFSRSQANDHDYQEMSLSCDLLIIDDLGSEFSTNFTNAALFNIINTRIIEHKSTIISTNLDETALRDRYGDRILSRLLCSYQPLQFYGEDIRMVKRFEHK